MSYGNYNFSFRRNKLAEPSQLLSSDNLFSAVTKQKHTLGTIFDTNDGRRFRYCENGTASIEKALMSQSEAPISDWTEQAMSNFSAAVGDPQVQINVATDLAANDLDDGWLVIVDVTAAALGDFYKIKSHTIGATPVLQLADTGGIRTVLTATTEVSVIKNPYKDVILVPASNATSMPTGIPLIDIPASTTTVRQFFWAQTKGPAALIVDTDNVIVGNSIGETSTANVAGAGGIISTTGTTPIWGIVISDNTSSQTDQPIIVNLMLE